MLVDIDILPGIQMRVVLVGAGSSLLLPMALRRLPQEMMGVREITLRGEITLAAAGYLAKTTSHVFVAAFFSRRRTV